MFGCARTCTAAENATLVDFYGDVCKVDGPRVEEALKTVNTTEPVWDFKKDRPSWQSWRWYEWLVLGVLALTVLLALGYVGLTREWIRKRMLRVHRKFHRD